MNDVINPRNGTCIWYHTTTPDRLPSILANGLKINSPPTWQSRPEPWIYVSTEPWRVKDGVILKVDLSFLDTNECGWAFTEPGEPDWEDRWQLRVFRNIPARYVSIWKEDNL